MYPQTIAVGTCASTAHCCSSRPSAKQLEKSARIWKNASPRNERESQPSLRYNCGDHEWPSLHACPHTSLHKIPPAAAAGTTLAAAAVYVDGGERVRSLARLPRPLLHPSARATPLAATHGPSVCAPNLPLADPACAAARTPTARRPALQPPRRHWSSDSSQARPRTKAGHDCPLADASVSRNPGRTTARCSVSVRDHAAQHHRRQLARPPCGACAGRCGGRPRTGRPRAAVATTWSAT